MAGLSEHDQAALRRVEGELSGTDPRLATMLERFGQPRARFSGWVALDVLGFLLGPGIAMLLTLL